MSDATPSPIAAAAYRRDWDEVERIRARAGVLGLHDAAIVGDADTLEALLATSPERVEEPAEDGFRPLHLACYFGHADAVAVLLRANAAPDDVADQPSRIRPLHAATAARATEVVAMLLEVGADPDVSQAGGYTPLMAAARHGDERIVRLLLEHGADEAITDEEGRTALEHATGDAVALLAAS